MTQKHERSECLYCPDCGEQSLELIETTQDSIDERKEIRTCDGCQNMIHIFRTED